MASTQSRAITAVDIAAEREFLGPALEEAVLRVLRSGRYVLGPEVQSFERDFAALHGVRHGVAVGSGTDALILALRALNVGPDDGVITSAFTFFASAGAIAWIGARPILVDVEPETGLIDPDAAAATLEQKDARCLLPVHLYGQLADMRRLRALADERGLALLEDAAQAHGARRDGLASGALGDAAAFSFYPTKNLGAAGEGGIVLTRDGQLAERLRRLRDHGSGAKYEHVEIGTNSRLQELQAAILNIKLPHLEDWNRLRRAHAATYAQAFDDRSGLRPLTVCEGNEHVFHQYALRIEGTGRRERVLEWLREREIFAAVHYPTPLHMQAAAVAWGYRAGDFPQAEALASEVLCLPVHPFLETSDVERVAAAVLEALRA